MSVPNTTCKARLRCRVPMNMTAVNKPHRARYAAMDVSFEAVAHPILGRTRIATRVSQKKPYELKAVQAKVFPFFHSMIPARTWAPPP